MLDKLLPTMGVGSYATPGWMFPFRSAMGDGRVGADDIREAFDDATRVVIADQIEAGVDILSDGELRRQRFVYEMYERIGGIERIPAGASACRAMTWPRPFAPTIGSPPPAVSVWLRNSKTWYD